LSPAHTTGQRYIYAGSAEGVINAWDVVSGKPVSPSEVFGVQLWVLMRVWLLSALGVG
jgi:hypothetical protein